MEGKRLLRTLRLTNFLSYGPEGTEIELQPLNVLIGPNGSGKSNLIEAISLLKAAPNDISAPIRAGGGTPHWCWKGGEPQNSLQLQVEASPIPQFLAPFNLPFLPLRHTLELSCAWQHVSIVLETIEDTAPSSPSGPLYRYDSRKMLLGSAPESCVLEGRFLNPGTLDLRQSILAQIKDPIRNQKITLLGRVYGEMRLFRDWSLGPNSPFRGPQRADLEASFLREDGTNLGLVLNDLLNRPTTKRLLLESLRRFYAYVDDVTTKIYANTVETFFHEHGFKESTPSIRLSDGTLRYLCLLTILCHPDPPPLVCIEDPEIGLHPDILPVLADLMVEASQRMQLIVTTHSDILVSALSTTPEAVVVCERDDAGSHLRRLDSKQLEEWLAKYSLGELWRMGETGGNP